MWSDYQSTATPKIRQSKVDRSDYFKKTLSSDLGEGTTNVLSSESSVRKMFVNL